jgi:hypothetical protein
VLEIGILKGSGLAMWCDLFPTARVIGVDIDLSHTRDNWPALERLGAFRHNQPELHEFDQLEERAPERLREILGVDRIDLAIDDGLHSEAAIMNTLRAALPLMANPFVYFIEDNYTVHNTIRQSYPHLSMVNDWQLTVLWA